MCVEPTTAMAGASLAIGTAGAVAKHGAAQADAIAQTAANNQQAHNAEVARNQKWNGLNQRQIQEGDAAQQALMDNSIRALKAADTAEVQGGEAGVAGNSVESVARDFHRQQGRIDATTIRNADMRVDALRKEKEQAEAERIGRSQTAPIRRPSLVNLGLEIGGAAVNAYDLYDKRNRDK